MSIAISEPKNQYQSEAKSKYRDTIWKLFAESVEDVSTAKVLFFPSRYGDEIPIALSYGFSECNLIACDENAAIIATSEWHKRYPEIKCYGTTLLRTIERLDADGVKLNAANIDICSQLCNSTFEQLELLFSKGILANNFILAWTLLKGREDKALAEVAKLLFKTDNGCVDRIKIISAFINQRLKIPTEVLANAEYRSDTKMMCYGVFKVLMWKAIAAAELDIVYRECEEDAFEFQRLRATIKNMMRSDLYTFEEVDALIDESMRMKFALQRKVDDKRYELRDRFGFNSINRMRFNLPSWFGGSIFPEGYHDYCERIQR